MGEQDERYDNALIYTIKTDTGLYVGSTIDFKSRCSVHKHNLDSGIIRLLYDNIRANDMSYKIEILHMFPCDNVTALRIEERRVADDLNANLNTNRPYVTDEERLEQKRLANIISNSIHNEINNKKRGVCECGVEMLSKSIYRHRKTDSHKLAMLKKLDTNILDFLTCKPIKNVVITKTNNSHTTPYPSEEEDE
tara:strand:- start:1019 stop:1600 length:582 start_codon:yes stop_codon:yes gene_type:complete